MAPQRYEPVSNNDQDDEPSTPRANEDFDSVPSSPPPSFRSRASSPSSRHLLNSEDPLTSAADRTLADTFDDGSASDADSNDGGDDRQRLMRGNTVPPTETQTTTTSDGARPVPLQRTVTEFPGVTPVTPGRTRGMPYSTFASSNDGVFANLSAKPERGEKQEEEKPPSYEAAAADATPPYWETTTILTPHGLSSPDEVYVDGLPVGSLFSFVWNGMISMSFQFVGFLLTYLLHTTHAAKNGSRAGLGITLIQYGFYMRGRPTPSDPDPASGFAQPTDPNSIDFDPSAVGDSATAAAAAAAGAMAASRQQPATQSTLSSIASSEWLAYALMIVGWFILIRALSDFFKARRHEQLVLRSPDRGLNVPIVAEGERAETVV
ncbi:MAG: hypothetical protein L6R39_007366 [Caloplaca ligustica]|nr:MAG: hypothetical protein L6R39_007366 [Caloplaca ligustica]